jgi:hypothetical protein
MLAISSDNIFMNKYAILGPTDPQITINNETFSFTTIKNIHNTDNSKFPLEFHENYKLFNDNVKLCIKFISKFNKPSKIQELIHVLSSGDFPHHKPIDVPFLSKFLPIKSISSPFISNSYFLLNLLSKY